MRDQFTPNGKESEFKQCDAVCYKYSNHVSLQFELFIIPSRVLFESQSQCPDFQIPTVLKFIKLFVVHSYDRNFLTGFYGLYYYPTF